MESIENRSAVRRAPQTPRLVADLRFTEIEAWAEASGWDLEFRQLSAGRLRGRARMMAGAHCTAMKVELNQVYHQVGHILPGHLTFGVTYPTCGEFNWCRSPARSGEVLNFNQEGGFEGTSRESFSGCALSFRREMLEDLAETLGLPVDLDSISRAGGTLLKASEQTAGLRAQFDEAFRSATESEPAGSATEASALFDTGAAESILRLLARPSEQPRNTVQPARRSALRHALDILATPENLPITVQELCRLVGVSAPSLYRAFRDEFGVSTKQYIQSRVLSGVRSELVAAGPDSQVNEIANGWGIWHMGQFAADYRKLFGELPSATLRS